MSTVEGKKKSKQHKKERSPTTTLYDGKDLRESLNASDNALIHSLQ